MNGINLRSYAITRPTYFDQSPRGDALRYIGTSEDTADIETARDLQAWLNSEPLTVVERRREIEKIWREFCAICR